MERTFTMHTSINRSKKNISNSLKLIMCRFSCLLQKKNDHRHYRGKSSFTD